MEMWQQHVLYLNRSLCKIKLSKIEDALWDCDQVRLDFTHKFQIREGSCV